MSWQEKQETDQDICEQFELLEQDMDRLMLAQSRLYDKIEHNTKQLTEQTNTTIAMLRDVDARRVEECKWLNAQKKMIAQLQQDLEETFKKREQATVIVKKWLELGFMVIIAVLLYKALSTSLWQTLGFKALYEQVTQYKYGGQIVTTVYLGLNLSALVWLVRRIASYRF